MDTPYIGLNRIEFVITYACTGRCKHCSVGDKHGKGSVDPEKARETMKKLASRFPVESAMCFGGEPLLCSDTVCAILRQARESGVPRRQIISNGFFSKNTEQIVKTAAELADAGLNEILLSVDAFHQETIPVEPVRTFASALKNTGVSLSLHPA